MPKLAQILKQSRGARQVCVSVFFLFWSLYKTNRFHAAVGLLSNRSQETSKCGKPSATHAHSPAARVPLLRFYRILTSSVICYWTDAKQHGIYLLNMYTSYEFTITLAAISSETWLAGACEVSRGICPTSCIWMAIMTTVTAFINV